MTTESTQKKRIAHIGPAAQAMGGMATVIQNITEYPLAARFELSWVSTYLDGPDLGLFATALRTLKKQAKTGQIDIAHVHIATKGSFIRKAILINMLHRRGVTVLVHMHGAEFREFYDSLPWPLRRYCQKTFANADCVIALSDDWLPFFATRLPTKNPVVIPNGVAVPADAPPDRQKPKPLHVLCLGQLGRRKGTQDLLDAILLFHQKMPDAALKVTLAGDGEVDKYRQFAAENHLQDIVFPGWISGEQKLDLLRTAHIIALPSYSEGCPMSILEGMSYGLPVLGTNIPSITAVARDGIDGYLVPTHDAQALCERLITFFCDDEKRALTGESARRQITENFSHAVISRQLEELYDRFLAEKSF